MAQKMGQTSEGAGGSVDNLTKKVQEMRTDDHIRHGSRQGTGGHVAGGHRGRGRGRGGHHQQSRPVEVPTTDFDFEESNKKFKKDVKEATESPAGTPGTEADGASNGLASAAANGDAAIEKAAAGEEVVIPKADQVYDKKTSFFDNISSELKDKQQVAGGAGRGQEFRSEERRKNMETFGQGSVDNNYRRGYGRGRGRGFRGGQRGGGGYGRGGYGHQQRGGAPAAEAS